MPRANARQGLLAALRFAGILDTSKGADVSDNIQLNYSLGDLSHLIPAIVSPRYVMTEVGPLSVANRSIIQISPPADSAIVVPWFRNDDAAALLLWSVTTVDPIQLARASVSADVQIGGAPRSLLEEGNGANPGSNIRLVGGGELPANFPPIVVPPGNILYWMTNNNNDLVEITVTWIEVPLLALTK